jgi:glycosyltransferase involved in cell wall biosynthesis
MLNKFQPVILQVLPELRTGGVERGTVEMTQAITAKGWKALVVSAGGELVEHITQAGGEHITLPLHTKNPVVIWRNAQRIERIIRERGVDIVHARSRAPAWSAYLAAIRTRTRFMTTFHGFYGLQNNFKRWYNSVMVRGERVIAVSQFVADHIHKEYLPYIGDDSNIRVVHRGADTDNFSCERADPSILEQLKKNWAIPNDNTLPIIAVPGRITRWKGQDVCIRALGKLPHRQFYCVIIGDDTKHPDYCNELRKLIREHDLEGHVRLVGNTRYMTEAYTLASLVICPSIEPEAFGRVPVEAQACARPVIATRHGGACETVTDGVTGWLVTPNDSDALARTIETALTLTTAEKEAMAHNARWSVEQHFSTRAMQQKTLAIYQELLSSTVKQ